ncbi:hypothetical protein WJX74_004420 [Apatococcus lobatus]|uniref:Uncharacterized protein n=1 Tax=Apatococcus lobatus TaxID=904363 RepID=A0AAW1R1U1_9CHLO
METVTSAFGQAPLRPVQQASLTSATLQASKPCSFQIAASPASFEGQVGQASLQLQPGLPEQRRQSADMDMVSSSEDSDAAVASDASDKSQEEDAFSSDDSSEDEMTQRSHAQPGETLEHPPIPKDLKGPMMEQKACSNVWYRASVMRSSKNEIYIQFPAATPEDEDVHEWVSKTSSRIWRGPMGKSAWKYLNDGAWEPRPQGKRGRSRSGSRLASKPTNRKRSLQDPGEDTGTSGLSAAETSDRLAPRDADDSCTQPSTHLAQSSRLRQSSGTAGLAEHPATSASLEQLGDPGDLNLPLASVEGRNTSEPRLADPLAYWFQQHFLALEGAGMLGLPFACSAESGLLPKDHLCAEGCDKPARLHIGLHCEEGCSRPHEPQAASTQHQSSLDEQIPQAADAANGHAAAQQQSHNVTGRRLGGKQDRGYREPCHDASGMATALNPQPHAVHQPSKCTSKSARSRAHRCLEDSSDDCSERDHPEPQQPTAADCAIDQEQQPATQQQQTPCHAQSSTEPARPIVGERELKRLLECDVFADPRNRRGRGQAQPKGSKGPQASSSSSDSGRSGPKQPDKKGGETEMESSPSPLSHAALPSSTRPSAANLPTQHGQPVQRPRSATVSIAKRTACHSSKGPRPQSAPNPGRPARPKPRAFGGPAADQNVPNGHAYARSALHLTCHGRPSLTAAPVQPDNGQFKTSQPDARPQLTERAASAVEIPTGHITGSRKHAAGLSNGRQSTEVGQFNRGIRDEQQPHPGNQSGCKGSKHPKPASIARNSHALVPSDCFEGLSMA